MPLLMVSEVATACHCYTWACQCLHHKWDLQDSSFRVKISSDDLNYFWLYLGKFWVQILVLHCLCSVTSVTLTLFTFFEPQFLLLHICKVTLHLLGLNEILWGVAPNGHLMSVSSLLKTDHTKCWLESGATGTFIHWWWEKKIHFEKHLGSFLKS